MQKLTETIQQNRLRDYEAYYRVEFERLWQDETTWVAEALDAPLEKDLRYYLHDGELHSREGLPLRKIFDDSINYYKDQATAHPEYMFQYQRALLEKEEFEQMESMAHGDGSNTMVVISTYPDELRDASKDVLGYQFKRKLGFLRIVKRHDDGALAMWTHSFDGNDQDGIEAIFHSLGKNVDWDRDVLGQRVMLDLNSLKQELLGDSLLYAYDKTLHEQRGGNWYAGRNEAERREAIAFVESQTDLVAHHVDAMLKHGKKPGFLSNQRYDFALAMRRRFEGVQVISSDVAGEMSSAGSVGRAAGETASGCGMTLEATTSQELSDAGYKIADPGEKMVNGETKFDDCMKCPKCKTTGVLIEKNNSKVYYTCAGSGGCGATTKGSHQPKATQQPGSHNGQSVVGDKDLPPLVSTEEKLRQLYGDDILVESRIAVGTRHFIAYDKKTSRELGRL